MSAGEAVKRDAAWVDREYGREKWPRVLELIDRTLAAEPEMPLARAVAAIHQAELAEGASPVQPEGAVFGGALVDVPPGAAFGAFQQLCTELVRDLSSERTEAVIELGSGWGRNLFSAWLGGGPRDATYVAAEYTEAGREASERVAALEPALNLRALAFDYNAPDLSALGELAEAVVITSHSIEQIPNLEPSVLDAVRGVARSVRVAHLEPVGWQLGSDGPASSRAFAEQHDYNRDLVEVLRAAESRGQLEIETVIPNLVGTRSDNASTLIVWRAGS
jgi:hypothetical protein